MPAETRSTADRDGVPTTVPDDVEGDVHRCPYCSRPFSTGARVDLHVGLEHYDVCTDAEADAFEAAYTDETEDIRLFRLKTVAVIVVLYFGLLIVYSLVT